jgi:hypothetical protein
MYPESITIHPFLVITGAVSAAARSGPIANEEEHLETLELGITTEIDASIHM